MSRVCSSHDIIQYCYKVCGITSGSGTTDSGGNTLYYKKKMIPKRIIPTLYKLSLFFIGCIANTSKHNFKMIYVCTSVQVMINCVSFLMNYLLMYTQITFYWNQILLRFKVLRSSVKQVSQHDVTHNVYWPVSYNICNLYELLY